VRLGLLTRTTPTAANNLARDYRRLLYLFGEADYAVRGMQFDLSASKRMSSYSAAAHTTRNSLLGFVAFDTDREIIRTHHRFIAARFSHMQWGNRPNQRSHLNQLYFEKKLNE
jgi:hypothetical protein